MWPKGQKARNFDAFTQLTHTSRVVLGRTTQHSVAKVDFFVEIFKLMKTLEIKANLNV